MFVHANDNCVNSEQDDILMSENQMQALQILCIVILYSVMVQ